MGRIDGRVALDCALAVLGGKALAILFAFLLGSVGVRFPGGIGTVIPAMLGVYWSATRLAGRDRAILTGVEAWAAAALVASILLLIEAGFTWIALSLSGRVEAVLANEEATAIFGISALVVAGLAFALTRLMFPLLHQYEGHRLEKLDRSGR